MAMPRAGGSASVLSSVAFHLLLNLTTLYFFFYFLFTLGLLVRKSLELTYPTDALVYDVCLLILLAGLELIHVLSGVRGHLTENEGLILMNLIVTGATILLTIYFLVWQTYVMRIDVILSSVLLVLYGLDGILAFSTLAQLASDK